MLACIFSCCIDDEEKPAAVAGFVALEPEADAPVHPDEEEEEQTVVTDGGDSDAGGEADDESDSSSPGDVDSESESSSDVESESSSDVEGESLSDFEGESLSGDDENARTPPSLFTAYTQQRFTGDERLTGCYESDRILFIGIQCYDDNNVLIPNSVEIIETILGLPASGGFERCEYKPKYMGMPESDAANAIGVRCLMGTGLSIHCGNDGSELLVNSEWVSLENSRVRISDLGRVVVGMNGGEATSVLPIIASMFSLTLPEFPNQLMRELGPYSDAITLAQDFADKLPSLGSLALIVVMNRAAEDGKGLTATYLMKLQEENPKAYLQSSDVYKVTMVKSVLRIKG
jgi:hypothetical protein